MLLLNLANSHRPIGTIQNPLDQAALRIPRPIRKLWHLRLRLTQGESISNCRRSGPDISTTSQLCLSGILKNIAPVSAFFFLRSCFPNSSHFFSHRFKSADTFGYIALTGTIDAHHCGYYEDCGCRNPPRTGSFVQRPRFSSPPFSPSNHAPSCGWQLHFHGRRFDSKSRGQAHCAPLGSIRGGHRNAPRTTRTLTHPPAWNQSLLSGAVASQTLRIPPDPRCLCRSRTSDVA